MSPLTIPRINLQKTSLAFPTERDTFSDLALNTLSVLGNFAMQCKRVLPEKDSQILSFMKCLNFVSAGNNFNLASKGIERAYKIKDAYGVRLNEVKLARSIAQFVSGILYFSSLGLSWSGSITSFKVIITASKTFSKTTTILSNLAIVLMLLNTSMRLHEQRVFQQELAKFQENPEAIARFLKEQMSITEQSQEKVRTVLRERYEKKSTEEIKKKGLKKPYYQNIDEYVKHWFPKVIMSSKKIQANSAYIKRVADKRCIGLINEMNIKDHASFGPVVQKVQEVVNANLRFNWFLVGLGCTGLLGLAISFIPGSAFVTLSTILGLIPTVAFSVSGVNDLIRSLQSNKEGFYDRLLLLVTGCVGIATSTALYAFTENPLVKAAAVLFASVWITLLYYVSLYLDNQPKIA